MTPDIQDLVAVSRYGGSSLLVSQGAGGNTSVKDESGAEMLIKASGYRLSDVSEKRGYVKVRVSQLREARRAMRLEAKDDNLFQARVAATVVDGGGLRPSLETLFHIHLNRLVLHTHSVYANAFGCMQGGSRVAADAVEGLLVVPYVTPGLALGDHIENLCEGQEGYFTILLENHGLISSGGAPADTIARTEKVIRAGVEFFGPLPDNWVARKDPPREVMAWCTAMSEVYWTARSKVEIRPATFAILIDSAAETKFFYTQGNLVPDDAVYHGGNVRIASWDARPIDWLTEFAPEKPSRMTIAIKDRGVILLGPDRGAVDSMEEALLAHVLVRLLIARRGSARSIDEAESQRLLCLDSEKYRQALSSGVS